MPLYDYECEICKGVQEISHRIRDKITEHHCQNCNKVTHMKKIITSLNFKLCGSCWAKDGYTTKLDKFNHYIK
jgi:putative FmdB family regulatory protein